METTRKLPVLVLAASAALLTLVAAWGIAAAAPLATSHANAAKTPTASASAAPKPVQERMRVPMASPAAGVHLEVGTSRIEISYHRPAVRERKIWGALVPYGDVWRTGANGATTISFSDPVRIAGNEVPAGTYAFFAIPREGAWTLILNRVHAQWGAYYYDAKEDQARFEVQPIATTPHEWLEYEIEPLDEESARISLRWEKLEVSFQVDIDVDGIMQREIEQALANAKPGDWEVYFQCAKYYYERNHSTEQALTWIDQSLAAKESFWNLDLKARLLQRAGRTAEALPLLERAIELSRGIAPKAYTDGLETLLASFRSEVKANG